MNWTSFIILMISPLFITSSGLVKVIDNLLIQSGRKLWPSQRFFSNMQKSNCHLESTTAPLTDGLESSIQSVVICGPSGVGKGTLITKLLQEYPNSIALSVSHTSRKPRPGEINGVHYHFVDKEVLQEDMKTGKYRYLETAEVHGNLYGTREDAVHTIHADHKVCLLDVDTKGVTSLKRLQFPMKSIFIAPPSLASLEARLLTRNTESAEVIALRIHNAQQELEYGRAPNQFDKLLENDELDHTYSELLSTLRDWFPVYFPK